MMPCGMRMSSSNDLRSIALHAEPVERELHAALVEQPHDDPFAVQHGDDRHADVDFAAVHLELDAAVLRQALFGDVQPRHDLEAADDRGLKPVDLRRRGLLLQDAVDAVANLDARGLRLDVHVARPRVDRFDQDFVHEVNDRRFLHLGGDFAVFDLQAVDELDVSSSSRWASRPSIVSLPTPRCVLIRLAIASLVASTGMIGQPSAAAASSSGYRLSGSDVATTTAPRTRSTGNSPWRWISLGGNRSQQRQVDRGAFEVDEVDARFDAQGPQCVGLAHQPQADGDLIDAVAVGARFDGPTRGPNRTSARV